MSGMEEDFFAPDLPKVFQNSPSCRDPLCGYGGRRILTESEARRWKVKGLVAMPCNAVPTGWHIVNPELHKQALAIR